MKKRLFAGITIIIILICAYWYGGSSENSHGWLISDDNKTASEELVSEAGSDADVNTDSNAESLHDNRELIIREEVTESELSDSKAEDSEVPEESEKRKVSENQKILEMPGETESPDNGTKDVHLEKKGKVKRNNNTEKNSEKNNDKDNISIKNSQANTAMPATAVPGPYVSVDITESPVKKPSSSPEKTPAANTSENTLVKVTKVPENTVKPTKTPTKAPTKAPVSTTTPKGTTCSISINCSDILKNMDMLAKGKEDLVPSDGVILSKTVVSIKDGDTVFDVLKRVANDKSIHLEYSYTPVYGSYYIEGIANLYEFDCGDMSGWLYYVNEESVSVGMSQCEVSDGDDIKIWYTCDYTS